MMHRVSWDARSAHRWQGPHRWFCQECREHGQRQRSLKAAKRELLRHRRMEATS